MKPGWTEGSTGREPIVSKYAITKISEGLEVGRTLIDCLVACFAELFGVHVGLKGGEQSDGTPAVLVVVWGQPR